jgi:hypothetical protein
VSRTPKEGLDYFPLVTRFEDKVELLIAEYGSRAVGIIVSLYQKIYSNSYYVKWDDDVLMLFSRYLNEEKTAINDVINRCFDREIFDRKMYEKRGILTSRGIQKQYLKVCKDSRRTKVAMIKEYCLITGKCDEFKSIITEFIALNDENIGINDSENTQSKVKESKVNTTVKKAERFTPPTVNEIKQYCQDRNNNVDPDKFHDFYQAKGWMVGSNKMKDWKAAVRTWEKKEQTGPPMKYF